MLACEPRRSQGGRLRADVWRLPDSLLRQSWVCGVREDDMRDACPPSARTPLARPCPPARSHPAGTLSHFPKSVAKVLSCGETFVVTRRCVAAAAREINYFALSYDAPFLHSFMYV